MHLISCIASFKLLQPTILLTLKCVMISICRQAGQ